MSPRPREAHNLQKLLDHDTADYQEFVIAGDGAGLLFRRVALGCGEAEYGHEATS